ncbi:MAG: formylglycine-generating enzyme family protein [Bacteroidales bacterium]|jgi:sulfatase modifying factor 1|nr:formylglycine-generating enzyme family protein [Bacteroidales bacterium]
MRSLFIYTITLVLFSCTGQQSQKSDKDNAPVSELHDQKQSRDKPESKPNDDFTGTLADVEMVYFDGGTIKMGSENGLTNEMPVHEVTVDPFYIDKTPVTNEQFSMFIEATGHKTEAEKFGDSGVFNLDRQAWELLPGAYWKKPLGPSGPDAEADHPVTHVSWNDAVAYASWAKKRLPTEAEWEYAARSGKNSGDRFSWGNSVTTDGRYHANTWQGTIAEPEVLDGYLFTSPVGAFETNEAGLADMGGNVWQWCADNYKPYPGNSEPFREDSNIKVIRSGSFFYDQNEENSFSVSGRAMNSIETSLFNTGFRCARDAR